MISYHATAFVFRCPVRIRVEGAGTFSFPRTVLFSSFTWGILRRRHFAGRSNFRTFTLRTDGRTLNRSGGLVPNYEVCRTGPETYQFFSYIFGKTPVWTVINGCHGNKGSGHLGSRNQTKKWPPQVNTSLCLFYAGLCHPNIHHLRLHSAPDQKINIQRLKIITQCCQNRQGCQV